MPKKRPNANRPLTVSIKDDQLVISIGVSTLAFAFVNGPEQLDGEGEPLFAVTDEKGFAQDVVNELLDEDELGNDLVTLLIDKAAARAAEQGSLHVEDRS